MKNKHFYTIFKNKGYIKSFATYIVINNESYNKVNRKSNERRLRLESNTRRISLDLCPGG